MSTTLEQSQYGFDRNSRRTWQKRPLTDTQDQQYNYDALSQVNTAARGSLNLNVTAISGVPAAEESWDYDPTGNWRGYHVAANGASTLDQGRVHDRGNRLTQIEDNPHNMILDRVGRMRQMSPDAEGDWDGKLEITWDAWSRITSVKNNGAVVGEYAYDGTHRRVTREAAGERLHSYFNDAWRPVEERKDSTTTAAMSYLWGSRHRDDLVRRDRAVGGTTLNETRYVLMDYFSPAAITDESGTVKERYAFSAFGLRTILNPDFTTRSSSECVMEFGFQGQFLDVESGLVNYGYRYYSPYLGRWTCKDPIGENGGLNIYEVLGNDAVNRVDSLGLTDVDTEVLRHALFYASLGRVILPFGPGIPAPALTIESSRWEVETSPGVDGPGVYGKIREMAGGLCNCANSVQLNKVTVTVETPHKWSIGRTNAEISGTLKAISYSQNVVEWAFEGEVTPQGDKFNFTPIPNGRSLDAEIVTAGGLIANLDGFLSTFKIQATGPVKYRNTGSFRCN